MNISDTDKKWLAERISKKGDLEKLMASATGGWIIEEFSVIPMGWSAIIRNERHKISIWSHRYEIETEEFIDGHWTRSEKLDRGWNLKNTDSHIVTKVLENATQEEAQQVMDVNRP